MSDTGIEFHDVWKKFHRGELHDSLRDLIPALARRILRRAPGSGDLRSDEFWAVRGVSFEVEPGEALGIIGPNGAGKSTILKLLTKILRPDRGHREVRGRIGALIEVSAGFHPDLTGRENVYLQGTILGMKRAEIAKKFNDIVDFSGISEFIDTPVKRYSSGMNARLGFSIAAHINPDVLIIDEVLSVGDHQFQTQAYERMHALCNSGIPVVLVSHNLERIASLCTHAILLNRGTVARSGTPAECIQAYVMGQDSSFSDQDCPLTIDSLTVDSEAAVRSGERVRLHVSGTISDQAGQRVLGILFRVRALTSSRILFSAGTLAHEVALPASGPFELEVDLQMNVPAAIYAIETSVWDRTGGKQQLAQGPSVVLNVEEGARFHGMVQMNPRMRLASPQPAIAAGGD